MALSLFFASYLRVSASLTPVLSVSAAVLWFTCFGCAGLLFAGGILWYAGCAVAGCAVLMKEKKAVLRFLTPGFLFFCAAGLFFIVLFFVTRPLFTRWDEFVFWGAAGKALKTTNTMYTAAYANIISRAQVPAVPVFSYMMQFFGAWAEYKMFISTAVFTTACLAAPAALWDNTGPSSALGLAPAPSCGKSAAIPAPVPATGGEGASQAQPGPDLTGELPEGVLPQKRVDLARIALSTGAGAVLPLFAAFLLPLFFEVGTAAGEASWAYRSVYGDVPLAALFGGALCFYFAVRDKTAAHLLAFAAILGALTCVKDMGFLFALIALVFTAADMLFASPASVRFFRLKGRPASFLATGCAAAATAGMYALWTLHMKLSPYGANRLDFGSGGESLTPLDMLATGFGALFGLVQHKQYTTVSGLMADAFFHRPVSVIGSGVAVLALIAAVLAAAWYFAPKGQKRRVAVFAAAFAVCFAGFTIFTTFTYAFIFKPVEALILKDYERYMLPFWLGGLLAAMLLLLGALRAYTADLPSRAAAGARHTRRRATGLAAGILAEVLLCSFLIAAPLAKTNHGVNFLSMPDTLFTTRLDVRAVIGEAKTAGMRAEDVVYLISQGDDGDRYYKFAQDLAAHLVPQYGGKASVGGETVLLQNVGTSLLAPGSENTANYNLPVAASPEDFAAYLKVNNVTHVLIDVPDEYILSDGFSALFSDGLSGWAADRSMAAGARYYRVQWNGDSLSLVKEGGAA